MTPPAVPDSLPTLRGLHCGLRELVPADATAIQQHADDEAVSRNLFEGFPHPYTIEHAQAWCGGLSRAPQFGEVWGIEVDAQAVGCIALVALDGPHRCNAQVGYWIGRAFWGRGIVPDALATLTNWAWPHRPQLTRLYAPIYARNLASQRAAAKAGYVREAELPHSVVRHDEVLDCVLYAAYRWPRRGPVSPAQG